MGEPVQRHFCIRLTFLNFAPTRCLFSLTFKQLHPSKLLHDCVLVIVIVIIPIIITNGFLHASQAPGIQLEPCEAEIRLSFDSLG
jgi:hypothetical protein